MNRFLNNIVGTAALCGLFVLAGQTASATVANTLATGSTGTVTATINSITFNNDPAALGGSNFACPAGSAICDSDVSTGTNLTFNGCTSGVLNTQNCLGVAEGVDVKSPITISSVPEPDFLTFANHPNLMFSLTNISTFTNTNCAALTVLQSCVVFAGSPVLLTLEPNNQTLVQLFVSGTASDTGAAGLATGSPYSGFFSSDITGPLVGATAGHTAPTPADIQFLFCGTNNVTSPAQCSSTASITSSQSGSFTATPNAGVPEPSSMAMMLVGGALVALSARRKRQTR